jgi:hypothetical protein
VADSKENEQVSRRTIELSFGLHLHVQDMKQNVEEGNVHQRTLKESLGHRYIERITLPRIV